MFQFHRLWKWNCAMWLFFTSKQLILLAEFVKQLIIGHIDHRPLWLGKHSRFPISSPTSIISTGSVHNFFFFYSIPFFTLIFYDYYWRWRRTWTALSSHWGLKRGQAVHTVVWLPPLPFSPFLCNLKTKQINSLKSKSTICWLMNFMNWMMMNIWNTPHWINIRCCFTNFV